MKPDYYLTFAEFTDIRPRVGWKLCPVRFVDDLHRDGVLVKVNPPFNGSRWGLAQDTIDNVVLMARHRGFTVMDLSDPPVFVYVLAGDEALKEAAFAGKEIDFDKMTNVLWAELYDSDAADRDL